MIKGISHITLVVEDLDKSARLYKDIFHAEEIYSSDGKNYSVSSEKFLMISGIWFALMQGKPQERTYRHIAFQIDEKDLPHFEKKILEFDLSILPGRPRKEKEGKSLYFYDYDNHLFELHTGDLNSRLNFYKNDSNR